MDPSEAEGRQHFFDDPRNTKWFFVVFFVGCGLLAAFDLLDIAGVFYHKHTTVGAEKMPGFYPIYGFAGIVVLVLLAKVLRKAVMRGEDYYDH